jgi:hypothetical protein
VRKRRATKKDVQGPPVAFDGLLGRLRGLIQEARQHALRAVDVVQVRTCWEVGRHIVEFEQAGADRAKYGTKLLPRLAERLTAEFGRGFDASNLRYMRLFYGAFPNCDALRHELSWTHYRTHLCGPVPARHPTPISLYPDAHTYSATRKPLQSMTIPHFACTTQKCVVF